MTSSSGRAGDGDPTPRVTAVCVVHEILPDPAGDPPVTAIDKRAVAQRVEVGELGVAGDTQCDTAHHGGVWAAVYAYADEDAAAWEAELGRPIPPGLFGENLRTRGVDVTGAELGERWQVGGADGLLLEVTAPRIPCATFQFRMDEPHWVKRFTQRGAPGAYLRVLRGGTVAAGDGVSVLPGPGHGITIRDVFPGGDADVARRLLAAADDGVTLAPDVRRRAQRALRRG